MPKTRLDQLLVERGLAESRAKAQAMIMAGQVRSGEQVLAKAGQAVEADAALEVASSAAYVSRGGDKLASVAAQLNLNLKHQVVLDVGSSTGGFSDYALQQGAAKVYAVDVGNNQLHWKLRQDERVEVLERLDIRELTTQAFDQQPDMAVVDVSFISLTKILPSVAELVQPSGLIVAMMKPQFEAGKELADRYRGVIKDEAVRAQIMTEFRTWLIDNEFEILAEADSKVAGAKGNLEHFFALSFKR